MSIDEKIQGLNDEDKKRFHDKLMDVLHDRYWCKMHRIDYVNINPYIPTVKEIVYKEMFSRRDSNNE